MSLLNPLWIDITWGAGGTTSGLTLEIAQHIQCFTGMDVMMHLTCTNMTKIQIDEALQKCMKYGVKNILALRGDPPKGEIRWTATEGGLNYAADLVKYIRKNYGDHFCICVAGYPETHLEAENAEKDIEHLKLKIDSGADLVITQLFYDNQKYFDFVSKC